jgi:hypothetical protein
MMKVVIRLKRIDCQRCGKKILVPCVQAQWPLHEHIMRDVRSSRSCTFPALHEQELEVYKAVVEIHNACVFIDPKE